MIVFAFSPTVDLISSFADSVDASDKVSDTSAAVVVVVVMTVLEIPALSCVLLDVFDMM